MGQIPQGFRRGSLTTLFELSAHDHQNPCHIGFEVSRDRAHWRL